MTTSTIVEETLWPEQETRKIPVDRLYSIGVRNNYIIVFKPGSKKTHRKEFAALRKEIRAHPHGTCGTVGEEWAFYPDALRRFAEWIELPGDLDTLMQHAVQEYKEQERERERKRKEEEERYHREQRERRVPCPSPCKIRVISLQCIRENSLERLMNHDPEDVRTYAIQLAESASREEREAHELFCKALLAEAERTWQNKRKIHGGGRDWTLHEYILLQHSEWLDFPSPNDGIENVLARAKAEYEAKAWEAYRQWQKQHGFFGGSLEDPSQEVRDALHLFDLANDASAEDIKRSYRRLAMTHHPDTGGDPEQFKKVNNAHKVLLDWFSSLASA